MRAYRKSGAGVRAATAIVLLLVTNPLRASEPLDPRTQGMGGVTTNTGAGTHSTDENPAALGRLGASRVGVTNADRHGLGIQDNSVGIAAPFGRHFGVAARWTRSSYEDDVISDNHDRLSFGVGYRLLDRLRFGVGLHYQRYEQDFEGRGMGTGAGWGLDLATEADVERRLSVGLVWSDVGDTDVEYDDGARRRIARQELRLGLTVRPRTDLRLRTEFGHEWHLGAEFDVHTALTVRAGVLKDLDGLEGYRASAGASVNVGPVSLDYAFRDHSTLDPTHLVGLRTDFTLSPRRVEIEDFRVDQLFASLAPHHATSPVGHLTLRNVDSEPVEAEIRVIDVDRDRDLFSGQVTIRPAGADLVELHAVLGDDVAQLRQARRLRLRAEVVYVSGGRRRTESMRIDTFLYAAGHVQWSRGVDQAAAFVTPGDPRVAALASSSLRNAPDVRLRGLGEQVRAAAVLFNGMSSTGLTYQKDQLNPYSHREGDAATVDTIQYPAQFLDGGSGDCDDAAVLYVSLLAHVGIRSALVDVPGHVFVLFDTAIPARERTRMGLPPERLVVHDGSLWIPVETTELGSSFTVAWASGAELLVRARRNGDLRLWDMGPAQRRFPPLIAATRVDDGSTRGVDPATVVALTREDERAVSALSQEYLTARFGDALAPISAEEAIEVARTFFLWGEYDRARRELERFLSEADDAAVRNNLANVLVAIGEVDSARAHYERARDLDPQDAGIEANLRIVTALIDATVDDPVTADPDEMMKSLSRRERPEALESRGTAAGASMQVMLGTIRRWLESAGDGRSPELDRTSVVDVLYWKFPTDEEETLP